jgi:hypothetical protein
MCSKGLVHYCGWFSDGLLVVVFGGSIKRCGLHRRRSNRRNSKFRGTISSAKLIHALLTFRVFVRLTYKESYFAVAPCILPKLTSLRCLPHTTETKATMKSFAAPIFLLAATLLQVRCSRTLKTDM